MTEKNEHVVHPSHAHSTDAAYHDVMDALSHIEWRTRTMLALESGHGEANVRRVLRAMDREGFIEEARSQEGIAYRFSGSSEVARVDE